jgi:beta-lactamase family protein/immune inhibitor InhA-like protein
VYATVPPNEPDTVYRYSDLNLIALGELIELQSGLPLDRYLAEHITEPLGLRDTGYNPPAEKLDRIAATEYQPSTGRGMVRGSVHDENAWALNGVAGHAGVFSTAWDLAVLAQTLLNEGRYGGTRILQPQTVRQMLTNYNQAFPGNDHGLGFDLYQWTYMDAMATPGTAGHTGFTGTSVVIDPAADAFAILLTNRVHPSRDWGSIHPYRGAVARALSRAIPVRPAAGRDAWFSGIADGATHDLSLALTLPEGEKRFTFRLWYDTQPVKDVGRLEVSWDGGATWTPLAGEIDGAPNDGVFTGWSGRRWHRASFDLGERAGEAILRWRYTTDAAYAGRGIYVDEVKVRGRRGPIRGEWRSNGWVLSRD